MSQDSDSNYLTEMANRAPNLGNIPPNHQGWFQKNGQPISLENLPYAARHAALKREPLLLVDLSQPLPKIRN